MLRRRPVDLPIDRKAVLRLHALGNYGNDPQWFATEDFEAYLGEWLATPQPEAFLASLTQSINDDRTIAEVWEEGGKVAGLLWVTFSTIEGYRITKTEVCDVLVMPEFQRRGIGTQMLRYAERGSQVRRRFAAVRNGRPERAIASLARKAGVWPESTEGHRWTA